MASYSNEEAASIGRILCELHVPSGGPGLSMLLLRMVQSLDELKKDKRFAGQPDILRVLEEYRLKLTDVMLVNAAASEGVINKLSQFVMESEAEAQRKGQFAGSLHDIASKAL